MSFCCWNIFKPGFMQWSKLFLHICVTECRNIIINIVIISKSWKDRQIWKTIRDLCDCQFPNFLKKIHLICISLWCACINLLIFRKVWIIHKIMNNKVSCDNNSLNLFATSFDLCCCSVQYFVNQFKWTVSQQWMYFSFIS